MGKPLVALMQPSAGRSAPHAGAVEAFLRPTKRGTDRIELKQGTSALPRCFNMLLADALNHSRDIPITHLAMIHNDVAPDMDQGWLDVLMDELEATGADMVSAVCPIKSGHGLTSTALDNPADPWVVRRLTMREVFSLPETFAARDVPWRQGAACLLANTGLWVAKFGAWVEQFAQAGGFRFLNRMVRAPDGAWVSQDCAEDWDMSRRLAGYGLKVACTRKVRLEHEQPQYHTRGVWGDWPTDLSWLNWQRGWREAAGLETLGWRFPSDVEGWLTEPEGQALAKLAAGKDVLEIGSYCGRSTVCLAQTATSVVAVDPFDGRATTNPRDTLPTFMESLSRYGVLGKVTAYVGCAVHVLPNLTEQFGLAFIDGGHTRQQVLEDAGLAATRLAPGGLLAFHDYGPGDPGVMEAVGALIQGGAELLDVAGTVAVLRPAA